MKFFRDDQSHNTQCNEFDVRARRAKSLSRLRAGVARMFHRRFGHSKLHFYSQENPDWIAARKKWNQRFTLPERYTQNLFSFTLSWKTSFLVALLEGGSEGKRFSCQYTRLSILGGKLPRRHACWLACENRFFFSFQRRWRDE